MRFCKFDEQSFLGRRWSALDLVLLPFTGKEACSPDGDVSPLPHGAEPGVGGKVASRANSFEIENLLKVHNGPRAGRPSGALVAPHPNTPNAKVFVPQTAEQVTGFCRSPVMDQARKCSPTGSLAAMGMAGMSSQVMLGQCMTAGHSGHGGHGGRQLSDVEKLRKVIMELVETERTYVKVRMGMRRARVTPGTYASR